MQISLLGHQINITKRSINVTDRTTGLPISFDKWINRFTISNRTPILENIYDTIATEFSKIDLLLLKDTQKNGEHIYENLTDNPSYDVLALRPNVLQTKSELLYTIAYQLHMYRNSITRIIRDGTADRNIVIALEPLDMDNYLFGQGYDVGENIYLKLKHKMSGQIILLDYNDLIHLRLNPNDFFMGDRNNKFDLTNFVKIFDENLSAMLTQLKEVGTVKGIIELGGAFGGGFNNILAGGDNKKTKQDEILDRIKATKGGGLLVLDAGEKWHPLSQEFKTMTATEIDNFMKYLYNFKGINQAVIDGTATEDQMEIFFNKTIMPIVERLIEELNYKFLTKTARTQGQKIDFFKNPFEYMSTKNMLSSLYLGAMFFSQNEIRHMGFKLGPLANGDELMDNKNFTKIRLGNEKFKSQTEDNKEGGADGENNKVS